MRLQQMRNTRLQSRSVHTNSTGTLQNAMRRPNSRVRGAPKAKTPVPVPTRFVIRVAAVVPRYKFVNVVRRDSTAERPQMRSRRQVLGRAIAVEVGLED